MVVDNFVMLTSGGGMLMVAGRSSGSAEAELANKGRVSCHG